MAAPFVEGRLRQEPLTIDIETTCEHCERAMAMRVDSELRYEVTSPGAAPIVFEPRLDWSTFTDPNIIAKY